MKLNRIQCDGPWYFRSVTASGSTIRIPLEAEFVVQSETRFIADSNSSSPFCRQERIVERAVKARAIYHVIIKAAFVAFKTDRKKSFVEDFSFSFRFYLMRNALCLYTRAKLSTRQIHRYELKFRQTDKISALACLLLKVCQSDKISTRSCVFAL